MTSSILSLQGFLSVQLWLASSISYPSNTFNTIQLINATDASNNWPPKFFIDSGVGEYRPSRSFEQIGGLEVAIPA